MNDKNKLPYFMTTSNDLKFFIKVSLTLKAKNNEKIN